MFKYNEIINFNFCSALSLRDYIKKNFSSLQDFPSEITTSCDISDSASEFSYSDLINEYTTSKNKIDQENSDLTYEVPSEDIPKNTDEWVFENLNGVVVPKRFAIKWAAQLLLALEKLHSLGVICW